LRSKHVCAAANICGLRETCAILRKSPTRLNVTVAEIAMPQPKDGVGYRPQEGG
jgi:hypothetical protein